MAGSREGGLQAAQTNREQYGKDYYQRIGKQGGSAPHNGQRGFGSDSVGKDGLTGRERARVVGKTGGIKSRRTK